VACDAFVPGLELSRRFHDELVGPVLRARFPGLSYAAARLDTGSELLGFDTPRSTDHDWGPRLQVLLDPADHGRAAAIDAALHADLPPVFLGQPTRFAGRPAAGLGVPSAGAGRHGVSVTTLDRWCADRLGFDPRLGVDAIDWLALPTQRLAEVTGGAVYHDGPHGALERIRAALAWYPDDVWRYVLACQWTRIGQEEHLMGRAGEVGDESGSAVLAGRLARDLMRLCLLLARRYPPYGKWLGSAFARLPDAGAVSDELAAALAATAWPDRERHLCRAYEAVGRLTNAAGLARRVDPATRPFHGRPFRVLDAGRFASSLRVAITDPWLRGLPPIGAIDQYVDSTDALGDVRLCRALTVAWLGAGDGVARTRPNER
jgi:hypothetical protein